MKSSLKKYWWVFVIIVTAPIMINYIVLLPAICPIVGDTTDWLSFWGGYLSAIISSIIAFVILYVQREENKKENKRNRELQIKTIEYQQQMQWLNVLRNALKENLIVYNADVATNVLNMIWDGASVFQVIKRIEEAQNSLIIAEQTLDMMLSINPSKNIAEFEVTKKAEYKNYNEYLKDLKVLATILCLKISSSDELDKVMINWRNIASQETRVFVDMGVQILYENIEVKIDDMDKHIKELHEKLCSVIKAVLLKEEERIKSIVTDVI